MTGLPSGWALVTVGDVATLTDGPFGSNLKTSHYVSDGPRVVRLQNIGEGIFRDERAHITEQHFNSLRKHEVVPGDVVVASLGEEAPRACLVPERLGPAIVKADCIRLRAAHDIEPGFVMWMLNSPPTRAQAATSIKGVGRPRLGLGGIRQLRLPLPPADEQRRIVAAIEEQLSRLDAADASLAAAAQRATVVVQAVLDAAIKGYPSVELGTVTTHYRYGTSVKCTIEPGEVAVLRIPNVRDGRIDTSDLKFATSGEVGDCFVEADDLLVIRTNGSRALIGRVAIVDGAAGMAFASYLIRARPTPDLDPYWGVITLSSPRVRAEIENRAASTAGQYNLNLASLRSLPIPLPPLAEQRRIVARVEEQLSAIHALGTAIERAQRRSASLRRAVLKLAFCGELVPQDPSDEPAAVLLERIKAERAAAPPSSRRRRVSA